jgi:hypothetical protein
MDELERDAPLFEGEIPCRLAVGERETRTAALTVRLLAGHKVRPLRD